MLACMRKPFRKPSQAANLRVQARSIAQSPARSSAWAAALGLAANAGLWIAVFAGLFFCEGRAYRDEYLLAYGLYPPMFPWDHGDMAYFGANIALSNILSAIIFPAIAVAYVIALLIILARSWKKWTRRGTSHQEVSTATSRRPSKQMSALEVTIVSFLSFLVAALIFMFMYFVLNKVAAEQGRAKAEQEIRLQDSCNFKRINPHEFITVSVERLAANVRERYDGFLITCSPANCAVRDPQTGQVKIVPRDGIVHFDTVDTAEAYLPRR
jgi:uncharacterized membrane protein